MKKIFIWVLGMIFATSMAFAQRNHDNRQFEEFKSQKISFITEKLNLSPREAQDFWPVYNQFEKEKMDIQKTRRDLEQKTRDENLKMSDQEIIRVTRSIASTFKKESELIESYNERFLKILPPQKVLLLYRAENQFRVYMFEQFKKRKSD